LIPRLAQYRIATDDVRLQFSEIDENVSLAPNVRLGGDGRDHGDADATLGIEKGKPFAPDARMKTILEKAAQTANDQMRVQSFADRRPDR
jgi:hypothetical protein